MVLSKRERLIVVATALAVAVLLLDRFVLSPWQERRAALHEEKQRLLGELEQAQALFDRERRLAPRWREARDAGLTSDAESAQSQALHAVRNWAQQSGLTLTSLRPEGASPAGGMRQIALQAAGTGRMSAVAGFLWRVEGSRLPIRVTELQVGARKEGTDDLSLQVRLSALYQPVEAKAQARVPPAQAPAAETAPKEEPPQPAAPAPEASVEATLSAPETPPASRPAPAPAAPAQASKGRDSATEAPEGGMAPPPPPPQGDEPPPLPLGNGGQDDE